MSNDRILSGALMVAVPVVFATGFTGLQMVFEYPDILRHPAGEVLTRFAHGGAELHLFWYLMMVAALAFIPAASYVAPDATPAQQEMAMALFDAANRYLGMGVGEHLGYLFTALWTLTIAILVWTRFRWLALAGIAIAAGVLAGMLEPFGVLGATDINSIAFSVWALWAIVLGVALLWKGSARAITASPAAA